MRPLPKRKSQKPKVVDSISKVVEMPSTMDQPLEPVGQGRRRLAFGLIAILLLGGAGAAYTIFGLNNVQSVAAERISTGRVAYSDFSETIPVNATLIPETPPVPTIPEISIGRRESTKASAKVAAFAYDRVSREPVWQSGVAHSETDARDTWVLGIGPFESGTVRESTRVRQNTSGKGRFRRRHVELVQARK